MACFLALGADSNSRAAVGKMPRCWQHVHESICIIYNFKTCFQHQNGKNCCYQRRLGLKIHPNAFVVGVLPQTPLGEPPQTPSWLGKETADAWNPSHSPLFLDSRSVLSVFGASTLGASTRCRMPRYSLLEVGAYVASFGIIMLPLITWDFHLWTDTSVAKTTGNVP